MVGQCSIKIEHELPAPAGVSFSLDHYNLYINPDQFDEYTLKERLAILKHEMLHILYNHVVGRIETRNPMGWNISTDCALNQHIDKTHLPDKCILPEALSKIYDIDVPVNQSSEFYYELLKEKTNQSNKSDSGEQSEEPEQFDSHETWAQSTGDKDLQKDLTKKMIEKAQTETIKSKGTVPVSCSEWLNLHSRKSEVNWKQVLRGILGNKKVGSRSTIMKNDRRFPHREDLRGKTKDRIFNLLVIADVSGSMSSEAIISTLMEVKHICDITKTGIDLIQVDTQAYAPEKLLKKTKVFSRKGAGGTYLSQALEKAKEHKIDYQAVVILTDGGLFGDDITKFSELKKKIIWLVEKHGTISEKMNSGRMQSFKLKT